MPYAPQPPNAPGARDVELSTRAYERGDVRAMRRYLEAGAKLGNPRAAREADLYDKGVAETNLGIFSLYGMGAPYSLDEARSYLRLASAAGIAKAKKLLAQLPQTGDPWVSAPPKPDDAPNPPATPRPSWASGPGDTLELITPKRVGFSLDAVFVATRMVAVGVPGDDRAGQAPGVQSFEECAHVHPQGDRGAAIDLLIWSTNATACRWEGTIIAVRPGELVAQGDDDQCLVRFRTAATGIRAVAEWPAGCATSACSGRTSVVGHAFDQPSHVEDCDAVAKKEAQKKLAPQVIGERPAWAEEVPDGPARAVRDYGGSWSWRHKMRDYAGDDHYEYYPVVDRLHVCSTGDGGNEFDLFISTVNDHTCAFHGRATENALGNLLFVDDHASELFVHGPDVFVDGPPCRVRLKRDKGHLQGVEMWPDDCSVGPGELCDDEASPDDASFPTRSRQTLGCPPQLIAVHPAHWESDPDSDTDYKVSPAEPGLSLDVRVYDPDTDDLTYRWVAGWECSGPDGDCRHKATIGRGKIQGASRAGKPAGAAISKQWNVFDTLPKPACGQTYDAEVALAVDDHGEGTIRTFDLDVTGPPCK